VLGEDLGVEADKNELARVYDRSLDELSVLGELGQGLGLTHRPKAVLEAPRAIALARRIEKAGDGELRSAMEIPERC
jgi:hypothetical protein